MIHETAVIADNVKIGKNVKIGPYSVVENGVELCDSVEVKSHVLISGDTYIGESTTIYPFAAIGCQPQDLKYKGEKSKICIGSNTTIREHVTIHPGTIMNDNAQTTIGDNCLIMVGAHIAHDCIIGNNVIISNNTQVAGHVEIGDFAIIGGLCGIHQFVRIGQYAMVGGMSAISRDVIPFGMISGDRASLVGINIIGMQRRGFSNTDIITTKKAVETIFRKEDTLKNSVSIAKSLYKKSKTVLKILDFIDKDSQRSYCNFNKR